MRGVKKILDSITSFGGRAPKIITRFIRCTVAGGFCFGLDIIMLFVLVELLHIYYLISAGIGFISAHSLNYYISRNWSFKGTKARVVKSYIFFVAFGITSALLVLLFLGMMVEYFKINYLLARFLIGIFIGMFNFFMNYIFSFSMGENIIKEISSK
jgi:putative flippase GtrA